MDNGEERVIVVPAITAAVVHTALYAVLNPVRVLLVLHLLLVVHPIGLIAKLFQWITDQIDALYGRVSKLHIRWQTTAPMNFGKLSNALCDRIKYRSNRD